MSAPKSKDWVDLPKPLNCFTVRSATMVNLNTGEIVRHYSANTKIVVVQKCVMPDCTYYRTSEAAHHYLNYAFKASAFGLPNEKAPSAPRSKHNSLDKRIHQPTQSFRTPMVPKQKTSKKTVSPKDGEVKQSRSWLKKLFRRKNGKTKNS